MASNRSGAMARPGERRTSARLSATTRISTSLTRAIQRLSQNARSTSFALRRDLLPREERLDDGGVVGEQEQRDRRARQAGERVAERALRLLSRARRDVPRGDDVAARLERPWRSRESQPSECPGSESIVAIADDRDHDRRPRAACQPSLVSSCATASRASGSRSRARPPPTTSDRATASGSERGGGASRLTPPHSDRRPDRDLRMCSASARLPPVRERVRVDASEGGEVVLLLERLQRAVLQHLA